MQFLKGFGNFAAKCDKIEEYDYENGLLIVTDTPDKKRVDIENFHKFKNVMKIDHHPKVDTFGKVEFIKEEASSASELVFEAIENSKLKMNSDIAGNIYIGIVSDTNRFLYNCNYKTFEKVAALVKKYKLDIEELYRRVYTKPLSEMRLMGHIASSLRVDKNGFATIEIDEEIIESLGADISSASNMINDFNNINEIIVWTFVTYDRKNNLFKVNIRSRGPVINEIAASFGGGGHKFASGVRSNSREVIDNLLAALSNKCKEYKEGVNKDGNN